MMLRKSGLIAGAALLALGAGTSGAWADDCHRDHSGAVLGAIAGGVLGGVASHGNGLAIAGGAIFGGMAGNAMSHDIDCEDRDYASRAYEDAFDNGEVGHKYRWEGHNGAHGYILVNDRYERRGHDCVDFTQVVWHHGDRFEHNGTACRHRDGWRFEGDND